MTATRVSSRIEAVTVYRKGARIRRVAEIFPDSRPQTPESPGAAGSPRSRAVCMTGLPLAMDDSSVRVSIEPMPDSVSSPAGSATSELPVATDARVALEVPEPDSALLPPVDEELEAARALVLQVAGRLGQVDRELARLEALALMPRPRPRNSDELAPPPPSPTSARLLLIEFREHEERALREERARLVREQEQAELRARQLEYRYQHATTARQAQEHELRKAVVIALHGGAAARARLVVEYMVPGARWAPAYTVRLAPGQPASFAMRAVVAQQTGEDWRGVAMTLSTADAQGWTELPELHSIRIGRAQPPRARTGWRPPPTGVGELYADYDRAFAGTRPSGSAELDGASRPRSSGLREQELFESVFDDDAETALREGSYPLASPADEWEVPTAVGVPPPMAAPMVAAPKQSFAAPPAPAMRPAPGAGGPPVPPSMPQAPMQRSTAPLPAKKRSRGAASAPSRDYVSEERRSGGIDAFGGGGGMEQAKMAKEAELEAPAAITARDELLAYGDLRMPPPHSPRRGSLRLAAKTQIYLELLIAQRVEVSFDVLGAISRASRRAGAVESVPLPGRCKVARSDRYDYAYAADTAVDVPSDGTFHSIPLITRTAEVSMRYVVVPRESTDVFRLAEVANPLGAPILEGPVDVYLGKDFLLTSDVAFTPPGGTLSLGLGVEQSIKVARNTAFHEETSGLMRGSLLLKHEIRIDVQNHLERAIECEVRERIPAKRKDDEDIDITVERVKPAASPYEPKDASSPEIGLMGGYAWRVRVDAGGQAALALDYTVKIPSKYELAGGNRREA